MIVPTCSTILQVSDGMGSVPRASSQGPYRRVLPPLTRAPAVPTGTERKFICRATHSDWHDRIATRQRAYYRESHVEKVVFQEPGGCPSHEGIGSLLRKETLSNERESSSMILYLVFTPRGKEPPLSSR